MALIIKLLKGLKEEPKIWLFLYLISTLMSAVVAIPFFKKTQDAIGNSLELNKLVEDFDFSAWSDFLRINENLYSWLFLLLFPIGIVYLLFSIYFNGGVLYYFNKDEQPFRFKVFFKDSWKTFSKFLVVYLLVGLVSFCFLCASGLLFFIATIFAENGNEKSLMLWLIPPTFFMTLFVSFTLTVGDYAKMLIYKNDHLRAGQAFSIAFSYVYKKPKTLLYFWVLVLISFLVLAVYLGLDSLIGVSGAVTIAIFFVFQQIVSFSKIVFRYAHLGLASRFFEENPIALPEKLIVWEEDLEKEPAEDELDENRNIADDNLEI